MKQVIQLVLGVLLTVAGPLLPAWLGGARQAVLLMDLGQDGAVPRVSADELFLQVKAPATAKALAPGLVELSAPAEGETALAELAARFTRLERPAFDCPAPRVDCLMEELTARGPFNRPSRSPTGGTRVERSAPRPLWLAGMALGLLGVVLVVRALKALPRWTASGPLTPVLVVGAMLGVTSAFLAVVRGPRVQQSMLVTPMHRPILPHEPAIKDPFERTLATAALVGHPAFVMDMPVQITVTPSGPQVLLSVEAASEAQLDEFARWVDARVVVPQQQEAEALATALDGVVKRADAAALPLFQYYRSRLRMPELARGPVDADPRTPLHSGLGGGLAGMLLGWALWLGARKNERLAA